MSDVSGNGNHATPAKRRKARELVLQAMYSWQLSGLSLNNIEAQFYNEHDMDKVDSEYFRTLLHAIPQYSPELDQSYASLLDRPVAELDPISLAILRIGTYEMQHRLDVPFKVVINEAVNLAKSYGPTDSQKYVNGVLDKLAPRMRQIEVAAARDARKR